MCVVSQLIAAYSTPPAPPAPPETSEFASESASASLDFKDSDMKRLSMEIERERFVFSFFSQDLPLTVYVLWMSKLFSMGGQTI